MNMIIPLFVHIDWIDSGYNRIWWFYGDGYRWQAYHDGTTTTRKKTFSPPLAICGKMRFKAMERWYQSALNMMLEIILSFNVSIIVKWLDSFDVGVSWCALFDIDTHFLSTIWLFFFYREWRQYFQCILIWICKCVAPNMEQYLTFATMIICIEKSKVFFSSRCIWV